MITFEDVKNNEEIRRYVMLADEAIAAMGYTEHSFAHIGRVADGVEYILSNLGYPQRDIEVARIAAYMHDIGNLVNREGHCQSGAIMAFSLLQRMGADAEDIAAVVSAIGNHDERAGYPVNAIAAALMLADKSDVRRSRVRKNDVSTFEIHDRVNYSAVSSHLAIDTVTSSILLSLEIDTRYSSVMEYFEIFLDRMILCRKAAQKLCLDFHLSINGQRML